MSTNLEHETFKRLFQLIIPPSNETARKDTSGKIGIVGGSKDYTGAPYYASMASLRVVI